MVIGTVETISDKATFPITAPVPNDELAAAKAKV